MLSTLDSSDMLLVNGVFCSPDTRGEGTGALFDMSDIPWDADSEEVTTTTVSGWVDEVFALSWS